VKRTNKHHRRSRSKTGGIPFNDTIEGISNVSVVCYKKHCAFHLLFPDTSPEAIAQVLTETWIDPAYILVSVEKQDARKITKVLSQLTR